MKQLKQVFDPRQAIADRLIEPIRKGKPELGWPGDPALALAFNRIEQRWELWEELADGKYRLVAKGPIGQEINEESINRLILKLIEMDTHRPGNSAADMVERVLKHNEKVDAEQTEAAADATADALAKFYYEAGKAFGVTRTEFYT